jgi:glucose/arabinose dehydrogenase
MRRAALAALALALWLSPPASGAPGLAKVGDFSAPTSVAAPPRDSSRLFVVERAGTIRVVRDGSVLARPFLDLRGQVATDGERGLLSMAFPPDYATSGLFYVYLVAAQPVGQLQIREYRRSAADPDRADPGGRIVWFADHNQASNHNGGQIQFGPDGRLWLGTGDGGGADDQFGHAQDLASPLGKVIRIDPAPSPGRGYTVPADNPYAGTAVSETVWARGLRNPFRFSFDRGSGDLWIGDVGQSAREEVDHVTLAGGLGRAGNFGWACFEGMVAGPKPCVPPDYIPPVFDYSQAAPRAITGGYVVRDPGLPTLVGRYVYADFYEGVVRAIEPPGQDVGLPQVPQLASFGEDACGHLYVVSLAGEVDRVNDPAGQQGTCVLKPDWLPPAPQPAPTPTPTPAPSPTPTPTPSVTPATLALHVRAARLQHLGRLRVTVTCTADCRVVARARVRGVTFSRSASAALAAGRPVRLALRFSRRGAARVRAALRRHRTLQVVVSVRASDAARRSAAAQARTRLRR